MTLGTIQGRYTVTRPFIAIGVTTGSHTRGYANTRPRRINKIMIVSGIQPTASSRMTYPAIGTGGDGKVTAKWETGGRNAVVTTRLGTGLSRHRGMVKYRS